MNAPQINSQLQPSPTRRAGLGANPCQLTVVNGDQTVYLVEGVQCSTLPAPAGKSLTVYVPATVYVSGGATQETVTVQYNSGSGLIHYSGASSATVYPNPGGTWTMVELTLDGRAGTISFSWTDQSGAAHQILLTIAGAPPAPPLKSLNLGTPPPGSPGLKYSGGLPGGKGLLPGGAQSPTGGVQTGTPAPTSSSSKTPYYVAGGAVLVAAGGAAWWKYGRKKR